MADDANGFSEGGGAAWRRDASAAKGKRTLDLNTSVTPERTAFPSGNLANPGTGASRVPSDASAGLSNKLTTPSTKAKASDGGRLLKNRITKRR